MDFGKNCSWEIQSNLVINDVTAITNRFLWSHKVCYNRVWLFFIYIYFSFKAYLVHNFIYRTWSFQHNFPVEKNWYYVTITQKWPKKRKARKFFLCIQSTKFIFSKLNSLNEVFRFENPVNFWPKIRLKFICDTSTSHLCIHFPNWGKFLNCLSCFWSTNVSTSKTFTTMRK